MYSLSAARLTPRTLTPTVSSEPCRFLFLGDHLQNGSTYAIRPLSICPACPVLSVTLVCCGQTVGWINMQLGMQVGLGLGHIVLDGTQLLLPKRRHSPRFSAHICCGQMVGWIKMPLGRAVGFSPGDIVLHGDPAIPPKGADPPIFGPWLLWPDGWMDQDATCYGGSSRPRPHCARWGPSLPKGHSPQFSTNISCGRMAG